MKTTSWLIGMSIGAATPMMAVAQSITLYGLVDTGV